MAVITTKTENGLAIKSPYNAEFVSGIKGLLGLWNAADKTWVVPIAVEAEARALLRAIYGEDGSPVDRVDLEIEFLADVEERGEIRFGDTVIAYARGRDSGAYPGGGIAKISGTLRSGGSLANFKVIARAGLRLRMVGVPRPLAARLIADNNNRVTRVWVEGASNADTTNVVQIRK